MLSGGLENWKFWFLGRRLFFFFIRVFVYFLFTRLGLQAGDILIKYIHFSKYFMCDV